jgi:transcription elongation factor GreA
VFVHARIAQLEALLRDAHVIADGEAPDVAVPGRLVDVEYTRNGRLATYRIAGAGSAAHQGTVSAGSPVGQGLIGRTRGDLVSVELPNGREEEVRIVAVRRDDEGLAAA